MLRRDRIPHLITASLTTPFPHPFNRDTHSTPVTHPFPRPDQDSNRPAIKNTDSPAIEGANPRTNSVTNPRPKPCNHRTTLTLSSGGGVANGLANRPIDITPNHCALAWTDNRFPHHGCPHRYTHIRAIRIPDRTAYSDTHRQPDSWVGRHTDGGWWRRDGGAERSDGNCDS